MEPMAIGEVVWEPSSEVISRSRLKRFMDVLGAPTYADLVETAGRLPERFWDAAVHDVGLHFYKPYDAVIDASGGIEWTRWFPGAKLNLVHSCLDRHRGTPMASQPALIWEGQDGSSRILTYAELDEASGRLGAALQDLGVERGDRVGIFLPMLPEVAVAVLACARIGAICMPLGADLEAAALAARLNQAAASVLICADGLHLGGSVEPMKEVADGAAGRCPRLKHIVMVRLAGREVPWEPGRDHLMSVLMEEVDGPAATMRLEPESPFMIMHTPGPSTRLQATVHVHAGFPFKAAQDLAHCFDVGPGDRVLWYTDMASTMGAWLILGTLLLGATAVIYEGAPDHRAAEHIWSLVQTHGITHLGVPTPLVRTLAGPDADQPGHHDLSSLRVIGGSGEPWSEEAWHWFFQNAGGGRLPLITIWTGSEISGGILCGNLLTPLRPCSYAGPVPGMQADVIDGAGDSIMGEAGDLALRAAWPGMTRGFWNDDDGYLASYWSRYPGLWTNGDRAYIDARDGLFYVLDGPHQRPAVSRS